MAHANEPTTGSSKGKSSPNQLPRQNACLTTKTSAHFFQGSSDFGDDGWAAKEDTAELRIWLVLDGATNCFVRLRTSPDQDDGQLASVALFDTGETDGQRVAKLIREVPLPKASLDQLTVAYRHGVVTLTADQSVLLTSYIQNGAATVAEVRLQAADGLLRLHGWGANSVPAPLPLTKDQQRWAAEAASADQQLIALYQQGKFAEAADVGERVLELRKSVVGEQHPDYATSLNNLAEMYRNQGNYARAEPLHMQALEIKRSVLGEQHPDYANSLNNLAELYRDMGDYVRAEPLCRQALEIRRSVLGEQHLNYAQSRNNLAVLYTSVGDYARAESLYTQVLKIVESVLDDQHPYYANSLNNLAALYASMSDYVRAESLYTQALQIRKTVLGEQHPGYAQSLNNLGLLYARMSDFGRAEHMYTQALQVRKSVFGERHSAYAISLNNLALLFESMGEYARAEPLYQQAVQIQRNHLNRIALVQSSRQQNQDQSKLRVYLDSYLNNALKLEGPTVRPLENLWQWKGAVTARQQAYRQVASNKHLAPLFKDLQSVSRQLSVLSGRTPIPPPKSAPKTEHSIYQQKRDVWESRFETLNREREDLEQQLAAASEEFRRIQEPLTVAQVQQWLPEDTAFVDFLEYSHSTRDPGSKGKIEWERRYIAFVVRPDREPVMIGLGPAKQIAASITDFRRPFQADGVTGTERQAAADAAQRLRRSLWLPLEDHLAGVDTVIISPDTVLGTLPFAALPGSQPGTYLLEDYRIATIPMAAMLRTQSDTSDERRSPKAGLLVLGDVDYSAGRQLAQSGSTAS